MNKFIDQQYPAFYQTNNRGFKESEIMDAVIKK